MSKADVLLQSAMTFREASRRTMPVETTFRDSQGAVRTWIDVVLHEANVSMSDPLDARPECPYLHPVDIDTADPGIVSDRDSLAIRRTSASSVPRIHYHTVTSLPTVSETAGGEGEWDYVPTKTFSVSERVATTKAQKSNEKQIARAERMSATVARNEEKKAAKREERANETAEERETRLQAQREKREARMRAKEEKESEAPSSPPPPPPPATERKRTTTAVSIEADASFRSIVAPVPKRQRGDEKYFDHPLPNHRLLQGLHRAAPNDRLVPALLHGDACDTIEIIQGPPGTGKTCELVRRMREVSGRIFACAFTNVGAANLYERCVRMGLGSECALMIPPDRIPPGVAVMSNDRSRRILCGTVSSRCGPYLNDLSFSAIFLDEAAQCMEAAVWTLLRKEVELLVMAGDVHQLPAMCSDEGRGLAHNRSLMERMVNNGYDNTVSLTVQNRMAPELMALPNRLVYEDRLTCGPYAPKKGVVEVHHILDSAEETCGTSIRNPGEVDAALNIPDLPADAIFLCPYAAQCRLFLSKGTSRPVHTIDSFQGREADTVVLSMVRDGSAGLGFWSDIRRVNVALTRARTRLIILASNVERGWPAGILRDTLLSCSRS